MKHGSADLLVVLDQRGRDQIEDFFVPSGESPALDRVPDDIISNVANVTRVLGRDKPVSSHPFRTSRYLNAQDNRPFLSTEKHGTGKREGGGRGRITCFSLRAARRFSIR